MRLACRPIIRSRFGFPNFVRQLAEGGLRNHVYLTDVLSASALISITSHFGPINSAQESRPTGPHNNLRLHSFD